jgi:hypothetical protein
VHRPVMLRSAIAAAAVGMALPTAVPGLAFALELLETDAPWLETLGFEAGLALAGALIGVLAVVTWRRGVLAAAPVLPVAFAIAVAVAAAGHVEDAAAQMSGVGPGPVLVWMLSTAGSVVGIVLQVALAAMVWGAGLWIAHAATRDPESAVGVWLAVASAGLHVFAKLLFSPIVFGILAAVLAGVCAVLARRWLAVVVAALAMLLGASAELIRLAVVEDEAYRASLPSCTDQAYSDPPAPGEYTRVLEWDATVLRAGSVSEPEQRGSAMVYVQRAFVVPVPGTNADAAYLARLTAALRARECEPVPRTAEAVTVAIAPDVPVDITVRATPEAALADPGALRARIEAHVREAFTVRRGGIGLCGIGPDRPDDGAIRPADVAFRAYDVEVRWDGEQSCAVTGGRPVLRTVNVELREPT